MGKNFDEQDFSNVPKLDITRFTDRETCLNLADNNYSQNYKNIAEKFSASSGWYPANRVLAFFVARLRGVHEAVVREIAENNPHSVFALLRVYFETMLSLIYCCENEEYVNTLSGTLEAELNYLDTGKLMEKVSIPTEHLIAVYHDFSRMSHPKPDAVMSVFVKKEDPSGALFLEWFNATNWIGEKDFENSCASINEMSSAVFGYLEEFAEKYIS
jgi:hypothetical protein